MALKENANLINKPLNTSNFSKNQPLGATNNMSTPISPVINNSKPKDKNPPSNINASKYVNFVMAIAQLIVLILLTLLFGSGVLYCCKVATANILPTDINCTPFTLNDPSVTPIDVDIDINKINDQFYSTKINFPFNKLDDPVINKIAQYNRSNILLDWLRKQKEVHDSWGIKMYFISVLEKLLIKNYSLLNSALHLMNQNLYEFIVLLLGPFILLFLSSILMIFNFFYTIYLWIIEFHWLFKENVNSKEGYKPKWEDVTFMDAFNFCISCTMAFWIFIILLLAYIFGFPLFAGNSSLIFIICVFSAMMMKSVISDGENMRKEYGIFKTFTDLLQSKMHYIMIIISVLMILLSFSYLGGTSSIFLIILCMILFVGLIGNTIYNRNIPKDSTAGLANEETEQAKRICRKIKETMYGGSGMMVMGEQDGGGESSLLSKLKKLSKEIKNNNSISK